MPCVSGFGREAPKGIRHGDKPLLRTPGSAPVPAWRRGEALRATRRSPVGRQGSSSLQLKARRARGDVPSSGTQQVSVVASLRNEVMLDMSVTNCLLEIIEVEASTVYVLLDDL